MKVKVLKKFKDKHTGKVHHVGEVFTCKKERYEEILKNGAAQKVGVLVEEYKEEKTEEQAEQ